MSAVESTSGSGPRSEAAPRGFWPMRDLPTALWLILTLVAATLHQWLPMPRWLVIHLLLLGAITHAILVWSQHFAFALLRSRASLADRREQNVRLILENAGAVCVFAGVPTRIWALTLAGALAIGAAIVWHGISLLRRVRGSLPGRFGRTIRFYIVAAALFVVGVTLGTLMALGGSAANLVLAHALVNVLGWVGLTVAGTAVTLWPTILRTRADERAALGADRALPALAAGVLVAAGGALLSWLPGIAGGLVLYLAGLAVIGVSLGRVTRQKAPRVFPALSLGAGLLWWAGTVAALLVGTVVALARGSTLQDLWGLVASLVPYLAAGFAAQVLIGALSYLIPVVLGGGPMPVRAGTAAFNRLGPLRVAVANAALLVSALPMPGSARTMASVLYAAAMASFLPIMFVGMRAQRRAKG